MVVIPLVFRSIPVASASFTFHRPPFFIRAWIFFEKFPAGHFS